MEIFFFFVKKTWSFGMQVLDLFTHIPTRSTLGPSDDMWGKFTGPKLWKQYILAVFRTGSLWKIVSYMMKQKKNQENVMFSKALRTFFHLFFPWHVLPLSLTFSDLLRKIISNVFLCIYTHTHSYWCSKCQTFLSKAGVGIIFSGDPWFS